MKKILLIISLIIILVGCSSSPNKVQKVDYSDQTLRIYSPDPEQVFYRHYGNFILNKFPGLNIQLVQANGQLMGEEKEKEIKDAAPDLIVSNYSDFKDLDKQADLLNLNTLIDKKKFDLSRYYGDMVKALSEDNSLYGLSPRINLYGLFYNKQIFDSNRISYPLSGMDWDEMFQVMSRFKDENVGFETTSTPSSMLMRVAEANKLYFIDHKDKKIVFNESEWMKAISNIVELYKDNLISNTDGEGKLFLSGKSAFTDASLSFVDQLNSKTNGFEWGIIPLPVNEKNRSESHSITPDRIFSIPVFTTQKELSLEIIEVLMSDDAADYTNSNQLYTTVSSISSRMKEYSGTSLEDFWNQSIDTSPTILDGADSSGRFTSDLYGILDKYLGMAVSGEISIEDCFQSIKDMTIAAYEEDELPNE